MWGWIIALGIAIIACDAIPPAAPYIGGIIALILVGILESVAWLYGKFTSKETRLTKIETVLIIKNIMPPTLAERGE